MNNRKYVSIYFDAFAKKVENDILMDAFHDNLFDFYISCRYCRYSTERLKQLSRDITFMMPFTTRTVFYGLNNK